MRKNRYYLIEYFQEEFQRAKDTKQSFIYERTTYTRKIKYKNYSLIFNQEGKMDDRILSLINKVRKDAMKYIELNNIQLPDSRIFFLDMFNIPKSDDIITKVDITKAYWKQGLMDGVISQDTDDFLNETFTDYTEKALKGVRLKALGSLATRKEIESYENGRVVDWEIKEQPTKQIYMNICSSIDQMMRKCRTEVDQCIFYYWDCMFVKKSHSKQVIDFFKSKDFECKSEDTILHYDIVGTKGYLTSEVDGKMYLVANENRNLLPGLNTTYSINNQ